jgi:hypothetical protein
MVMDTFVVDTNILINLDRFNPQIFESLWNNIDKLIQNKKLFSVVEVHEELNKRDDRIFAYWDDIHNNNPFFINPRDTELKCLPYLAKFKIFQKYGKEKDFWADPYLIAFGMTINAIVVTQETLKKKPERKMPFVCKKMGITCMNLDEFMIYNGWKW